MCRILEHFKVKLNYLSLSTLKCCHVLAEEKHADGPTSEATNTLESNYENKIGNNLLKTTHKVTENYNEFNTNTRNKDKTRKNTVRVFDMKSKQYVTIELAGSSKAQTDIITDHTNVKKFQVDVDYKTPNVDMANKTNNETVSYIRYQKTEKINDFINKNITLNESGLPTNQKASDFKTQKFTIAEDTQNKTAYSSSTKRTTETKDTKIVKIPSNNKKSSLLMRNFNERHEKKRLTCEQVIVKICDLIESSKTVTCGDDTTIPLKRLCDGYIDCPDKSDEESCSLQGTELVLFLPYKRQQQH